MPKSTTAAVVVNGMIQKKNSTHIEIKGAEVHGVYRTFL